MKWVIASATVMAVIVLGSELFARFALGLGTPPLSVAHPTIEYMFAPNQDVWPFRRHFQTNEYGMRSPPLRGDNRRRVLVLGDSVVNGGNLTDQADLATSVLTDSSTLYLNASAGSWGPANMLAYLDTFGTFDAEQIVVVLSTHDLTDHPTFAPLDPNTHPTVTPVLAIVDGAQRYLPRYLPFLGSPQAASIAGPAASGGPAEAISLLPATCFVFHRTRSERGRLAPPEFDVIRQLVDAVVDDALYIPADGYQDDIHLNAAGQLGLARAIQACLAQG